MRKLNTLDVFLTAGLIEQAGIKEALLPIIKKIGEEGVESITDIGITGLLTVIGAVGSPKGRNAIFEILANIKGCTVEEFQNADIDEFGDFLNELYETNKDSSFFSVLSRFLLKKS